MPTDEHKNIEELLERNTELVQENNTLLRKMHRWNVIGVIFRVFWYALLIGLPFALYFYFLEPYFQAVGSDYQTFTAGFAEIPGLKGLGQLMERIAGYFSS